jgi:hypothetical protein
MVNYTLNERTEILEILGADYQLFYGLTTMMPDEFLNLPYEPVPSFWFTMTRDLEDYFYNKYGSLCQISPNDEMLPAKIHEYGTISTGVCQSVGFIIDITKH